MSVATPSETSLHWHPMVGDPVFDLHVGSKIEVRSTVALDRRDDLSMAYTPGVARVCEAIAADPSMTRHYTWVPNTVAVVTDGTIDVDDGGRAGGGRVGTQLEGVHSQTPRR
jgi:malate dehydrogenase (oxaloacetate-decarboxylating)